METPKPETPKAPCRFKSLTRLQHCEDEFARENDCEGCEVLEPEN